MYMEINNQGFVSLNRLLPDILKEQLLKKSSQVT